MSSIREQCSPYPLRMQTMQLGGPQYSDLFRCFSICFGLTRTNETRQHECSHFRWVLSERASTATNETSRSNSKIHMALLSIQIVACHILGTVNQERKPKEINYTNQVSGAVVAAQFSLYSPSQQDEILMQKLNFF